MSNDVTKPKSQPGDGFGWEIDAPATGDEVDRPRPSRTMQGDAILKYAAPTWTVSNIPCSGRELLCYDKSYAVVRWGDDKRLVYAKPLVRGEPPPDLRQMNAEVPVNEWRIAFGKPQPPFELQRCWEFLDPVSMDRLSWPHNVNVHGSSIASDQLERKIGIVRRLHGADLYPITRLDHAPMPTRDYGIKQRPNFPVVKWARLSDRGIEYVDISASAQAPKQLPQRAAPPTQTISEPSLSEEMADEVKF